MTNVLCIAGRKGSGKTTAARFLHRNCNEFGFDDVGLYSLAGPLKALCIDLLGLTHDQCYGTDEQKNTPTGILWGDFPGHDKGFDGPCYKMMTAREVLQHVGTEIFRRMKPGCWIDKCLRAIHAEGPALAVVDDARFPEEVAALRKEGKAVFLTRNQTAGDRHASETSFPGPEAFDLVLDNAALTADETNARLVEALRGWGWIK